MTIHTDYAGRRIRFTEERIEHILANHPEMAGQLENVGEVLKNPDAVTRSLTDRDVEIFYKKFDNTPVSEKHLCVIVKKGFEDLFVVTSYFTDTVKRGEKLWLRK